MSYKLEQNLRDKLSILLAYRPRKYDLARLRRAIALYDQVRARKSRKASMTQA